MRGQAAGTRGDLSQQEKAPCGAATAGKCQLASATGVPGCSLAQHKSMQNRPQGALPTLHSADPESSWWVPAGQGWQVEADRAPRWLDEVPGGHACKKTEGAGGNYVKHSLLLNLLLTLQGSFLTHPPLKGHRTPAPVQTPRRPSRRGFLHTLHRLAPGWSE